MKTLGLKVLAPKRPGFGLLGTCLALAPDFEVWAPLYRSCLALRFSAIRLLHQALSF